MKRLKILAFVILATVVITAATLPLFEYPCLESKQIMSVGGCSHNGFCGVMFTDGTFGRLYYPVVLQKVCTKHDKINLIYKIK